MSDAISDLIGFVFTLLFVALFSYVNYRSKRVSPPPPPPPKQEPLDQLLKEVKRSIPRPPAAPKAPFQSNVEKYEETEGVAQRHLEEAAFQLEFSSNLISEEAEAAYQEYQGKSARVNQLLSSDSLRASILLTEILGKPRGA